MTQIAHILGYQLARHQADFEFCKSLSCEQIRNFIIAQATDGYSVWVTVFRGDPAVLAGLANKYPGTRS